MLQKEKEGRLLEKANATRLLTPEQEAEKRRDAQKKEAQKKLAALGDAGGNLTSRGGGGEGNMTSRGASRAAAVRERREMRQSLQPGALGAGLRAQRGSVLAGGGLTNRGGRKNTALQLPEDKEGRWGGQLDNGRGSLYEGSVHVRSSRARAARENFFV